MDSKVGVYCIEILSLIFLFSCSLARNANKYQYVIKKNYVDHATRSNDV